MSSGIRMPGKKSSGSSGMRTMGARPVPAKPSIRRQPPPASLPQRPGGPQQGNWGKGEGDGDIPLAAATGVAPPQPEVRNSVEYTLVSSRLPRTHNVMRLLSPKQVNFDAFTGPVKLRRRNKEYYRLKNKKRNEERAAALEQEMQKNKAEGLDTGTKEEVKERPKADMNLIADVGGARSNKKNLFKKRTKQVYMADEDKRRLDIEEARPWVLEDDDEKEVWTGSLEGGQNSSYVLFVLTEDGFKVVPVDRWYKFTPKLKFKTLTLDEAEEEIRRAQKNEVHDRWMMRNRLQAMDKDPEKKDDDDEGSSKSKKPKVSLVEYEVDDDIFGDDDEDEDAPRSKRAKKKGDGSNKHAGVDEYDFEMEFDDDEELGDVQFEYNQEETNEKKEQKRMANKSGYESEEEGDGEADVEKDLLAPDGQSLKKLLRKREGNDGFQSEDEENPYLSISEVDSDESDEEPETKPEGAEKEDKPADSAADTKSPDGSARSPDKSAALPPSSSAAAAAATAAKKRKRVSTAPTSSSSAPKSHPKSDSAGARPPGQPGSSRSSGGSDLITKQEIIDLIKSGVNTTKELIGCVRRKLKANPANKNLIQSIVKEVATLKDSILTLKKA